MFQSRVFKRMFFSYILIIAVSFSLYAVFLVYQNRRIDDAQAERDSELTLREAADMLDGAIGIAQDVVRDLRYSTVMRDLYMATRLGNPVDSYTDYAIQTELKGILSSHGASLYGVSIFLEGSERAYSGGGVLYLDEPFIAPAKEQPFLAVGSIADIFGFKNNKRYYFQKRGMIYCDSYTYRTGVGIGCCCVFIDADRTESALSELLDQGSGVRVLYRGEEILTVGGITGEAAGTRSSDADPEVVYELYGNGPAPAGRHFVLYGMLLILALVFLFFVWLAYWQSKRYYQPIGVLGSMVSQGDGSPREDEMDGIIGGIRELIGEKNRYHEKILTIGPYAGAGMLQAIVAGGEGGEKLSVLTDEDFLDLKHLYYVVSVVNLAYEGNHAADEGLRERLDGIIRQTAGTWSTEERHIAWYFRDVFNIYLIVNDDEPELSEDLFFNLRRQLAAALEPEHLLVTMGVDRPREEIAELKTACESAMNALEGMLRDGRGEVFFAGEEAERRVDYYFPAGFTEQLRGFLERRDRGGIHGLLFEVYKKNLELAAPADVYHALVDELYPAVMRAIKETAGLTAVHLNIRRAQGLMTLQEIFDYYDAVLMSVTDLLEQDSGSREEDALPDEEILRYVDEHFCDQDISLQFLSDHFRVSNKYLLLLYKQRHGMTYLQYLQNKRIARAAEMIRRGGFSLAEIGERVGYPNQLTFRRNFKAVMGVNPSEYAAPQ